MTKQKIVVKYRRIDHLIILQFPNGACAGAFLSQLASEINLYTYGKFKEFILERGL